MDYSLILIDDPAPVVRRITLNRPEKRNALNATLRREILAATREADRDTRRPRHRHPGAGKCFSAGYDLSGDPAAQGEPLDYNAEGEGSYMRGVTNGWMSIWDLAKPVIAQVHGYCLAGGSELATGCDLVYVAEDAKIGYPAVRFGTPDMQYHAWLFGMRGGMESMLTGDSFSGDRGRGARVGEPRVPGSRARGAGPRDRVADRADPHRPRADQQAHRAPGHGGHGPALVDPGRHRAQRARHPHRVDEEVRVGHPVDGPARRARRARHALRRLPHVRSARRRMSAATI